MNVFVALAQLSCASAVAQVSPEQIVDRFYPEARLEPADPSDRASCFAVHSFADGEPALIVAGYTNRLDGLGVVRVIRRNADGYAVAFEAPGMFFGSVCDVELPDVDFDGRPDVWLSFGGGGGSDQWLFKWDGAQLVSITPVTLDHGEPKSSWHLASLIDVTHSGWLQAVMPGWPPRPLDDNQPQPAPDEMWEAVNGMYERTRYVLGTRKFIVADVVRDADNPYPLLSLYHFRQSEDSTPPFHLRIVNGDRYGQHRVSSGSVTVNDSVVVSASQLTSGVEFVDVTLPALPIENVLRVSLAGNPDGFISFTIADSTVRRSPRAVR